MTTSRSKKNSYGTYFDIADSDIELTVNNMTFYFTNTNKLNRFFRNSGVMTQGLIGFWEMLKRYKHIQREQTRVIFERVEYYDLRELEQELVEKGVE